MDWWSQLQRRALGLQTLDYAWVDRWRLAMGHGQRRHTAIGRSPARPGKRPVGWLFHAFIAACLLAAAGPHGAQRPISFRSCWRGVLSLAAPCLIVQPACGMRQRRRTPRPAIDRLCSLDTYLAFGLDLYLAARVWALSFPG